MEAAGASALSYSLSQILPGIAEKPPRCFARRFNFPYSAKTSSSIPGKLGARANDADSFLLIVAVLEDELPS